MQSNSQVMTKFKAPIQISGEELPDADEGSYEFVLKATSSISKQGAGSPMITIQGKIKTCNDDQDERNIGRSLRTWVMFSGTSSDNRGKRQLKACFVQLDLEWGDVVPETATDLSDFDPILEALNGKTVTGWVQNEVDRRDPENGKQSTLYFKEPAARGGLGLPAADDDDEDDATPKKKAVKAGAAKRR